MKLAFDPATEHEILPTPKPDLTARTQQLLEEIERVRIVSTSLETEHGVMLTGAEWVAITAKLKTLLECNSRSDAATTLYLQIRSFGAIELRFGGQPIKLPFARCGELIVWLAMNGPATREKIVDALWDGSGTQSHLEYFRVVVRRTRAALMSACGIHFNPLLFDGGRYQFAPQISLQTDFSLLETALKTPTLENLNAALEVYDGDFLPAATTEWATLQRTLLLDAAVEATLRLGEILEGHDLRAALIAYRRALHLEPLTEIAHAAVIRLHERLGQNVAAETARRTRRRVLQQSR
jgi:LuxR family transcriptional regulator, maltose regulon positive regulatory protein